MTSVRRKVKLNSFQNGAGEEIRTPDLLLGKKN